MTASIGTGETLDAPAITPPPNGLLNTAAVIDHGPDDIRWLGGISFSPENFAPAVVLDPCATTPFEYERNRAPQRSVLPFPIEAYDQCSSFGFSKADYEGRARRALAARESEAIEKELDTGSGNTDNPHFQDGDFTSVIAGTFGIDRSLGIAVQAIADNRLGIGMIHARPSIVTAWNHAGALLFRNNKIYTIGGHLVVPGSGYSGAAVNGTPPTTTSEWVYVTDMLIVHRGPVEVFTPEAGLQYVDRATNTVEVRAQRTASVVGNFPGIWAINVNPSTI